MKMLFSRKKNNCKTIRYRFVKVLTRPLSIRASWVQAHIAGCPRCQQRISGFNRVALGLSLMKTQVHSRDLLKRANQQAISVLQSSLRCQPQADKLRQKQPRPRLRTRMNKYTKSLANAAACLALLLLMRTGIFSGMEKLQTEGQKALRQHYVQHLGEDMTNDIFMA